MRYAALLVIIMTSFVSSAFAESTPIVANAVVDQEQLNEDGVTALTLAVRGCNIKDVTALLKAGANPNTKNKDGSTALMWVGYYSNPPESSKLEIAKLLVESGADVNARNVYGRSVLSYQASYNLSEVISYLVSKGADDKDYSALLYAIESGRAVIVQKLLSSGINPNNERIIWAAMHYDSDEVRKAMLATPKFDKKSPFWVQMAAMEGRNETLKRLIALGADINGVGEGHQTALLRAIDEDKTESAKILIAAGAKTDTISESGYGRSNGETALCLASRKGNFEVVKSLIAAKADVNATCGSLVAATKVGHLGIVEALVAAAADLQDRYTGNWNALFVAAENDRLDIAKALIKGGVRIDVRDNMDSTPLMIAASKGSLNVIRLLVEKGANLEATNAKRPFSDTDSNYIGTPLGWAIEYKQDAAVALLRQLGAKR
jgi:ankyrin repeat protein